MFNDQHTHSFRVDGTLCNPEDTKETVVQVSESIVGECPDIRSRAFGLSLT